MKKSVVKHWQKFWFAEVYPHNLALLRIALGCFLVVYWCVYLPRFPLLFSNQGLVISYFYGTGSTLEPLFATLPPALVTLLYFLAFLAIFAFLLGYHLRIAGSILLLLALYFYYLSFHHFPSSYNRLIFFVTLILTFSGADRTLSLRMKTKKGSIFAYEKIPVWPQRILMIQVTATYFGVGLQKFLLPGWEGGEILYYPFIGRWGTWFGFWFTRRVPQMVFYDFIGATVKYAHVTIAICLWLPGYRKLAFILGTLFHLSVTMFMGMWWFLVLIPCYIVFVPNDRVQKWVDRRKG